MAIALVAIVAGALLFHFWSPWWLTPLASNWRQMDDTLAITLLVTGIFFVVINLFLGYILLRFRHREGSRAAWWPDSPKLERWLLIGTSLAIMGLLAPGLFVYADYIRTPDDAIRLEALGQQWQWRFRFPGADGRFGGVDPRFVNTTNPFGIDPDDPHGRDNILVNNNEVRLPVGKPVKMLLRSHDVLHDFYVPQFRARMNIVPGMVTTFWFTPTAEGRYEILCAQLCGVGHSNMRGHVVVVQEAAFHAWLREQPTFAATLAPPAAAGAGAGTATPDAALEKGRLLAQSRGCVACHSVDGSAGVGPSWKGLFGHTVKLADGSSVKADQAYLKRSITDPQAQLVAGFAPIMPKADIAAADLDALVAYIASIGAGAAHQ